MPSDDDYVSFKPPSLSLWCVCASPSHNLRPVLFIFYDGVLLRNWWWGGGELGKVRTCGGVVCGGVRSDGDIHHPTYHFLAPYHAQIITHMYINGGFDTPSYHYWPGSFAKRGPLYAGSVVFSVYRLWWFPLSEKLLGPDTYTVPFWLFHDT